MQCVRCNKRGLFFRVNVNGLCKNCQLIYDQELEQLRTQAEQQRDEAIRLYDSLCSAYSIISDSLHYLNPLLNTAETIDNQIDACRFIIENISKHTKYDCFSDLYKNDCTPAEHAFRFKENKKLPAGWFAEFEPLNLGHRFSDLIKEISQLESRLIFVRKFYQQQPKASFPSKYIVLDIETTGLNSYSDSIIEIAAAKYINGESVEIFHSLVYTSAEIPVKIQRMVKILPYEVAEAPKWNELEPKFLRFIDTLPLVGHNIKKYDINFINKAVRMSLPNELYDTLELSRQTFPGLASYKLESFKEIFGLGGLRSHQAKNDIEITNALLQACLHPSDYPALFSQEKIIYPTSPRPKDIIPSNGAKQNTVLRGKIVVFTGPLSVERNVAMQIAVDAGAILRSDVSSKTDYLVIGTYGLGLSGKDFFTTKRKKAEKINSLRSGHIQIIDESTFIDLTKQTVDISTQNQTPPETPSELIVKLTTYSAPERQSAISTISRGYVLSWNEDFEARDKVNVINASNKPIGCLPKAYARELKQGLYQQIILERVDYDADKNKKIPYVKLV